MLRAELARCAARPPSSAICKRQRRPPAVMVPHLDRVDAVPMRALAARQQEIDRGRTQCARRRRMRSSRKRLAIMPAFRMRLQVEPRDDLGGRRGWHITTCSCARAARRTPAPDRRPSCAAWPRLPARRRAGTRWPSSRRRAAPGIVGLFSARSLVTSSARACRGGVVGLDGEREFHVRGGVFAGRNRGAKSSGSVRSFNSESHIIG